MDEEKRVLIIDDTADSVLLLKESLEENGFACEIAESPEEGLSRIEKFQPAIIILDIKMPRISGFAIMEQLRERGFLSRIPVVVLSVLDDREIESMAKSLGAFSYFSKRTSPKKIIHALQKIAA